MLDITRGRSLATTAPAGSVGDESFPPAAQQPPGLIPGTLATCPTECTPRPRIPEQYKAACAAAEGDPVRELDASQVVPGMTVWHLGHFRTVVAAGHPCIGDIAGLTWTSEDARNRPFVVLRLRGADATGWLLAELDSPVYVLAPTPGAPTAPGAGAPADESTGGRHG